MDQPSSLEGAAPGLRVLLGGVPFGRDNIGDEAIVECVVAMVRAAAPEAQVAISCDDPQTAMRLGVATERLLGFLEPWTAREAMREVLKRYDAWIWAGATGLSDYPHVTLRILQEAKDLGLRRIVLGVGMNSELNPALYRIGSSWKKALLERVATATRGRLRLTEMLDRTRDRAMRREIGKALASVDLLVVRDAASREELCRLPLGLDSSQIVVGADPALRIRPLSTGELPLRPDERRLLGRSSRRIGICISSQRPVASNGDLERIIGGWLDEPGVGVFGIPMNPVTDAELLRKLRASTRGAERFLVVEGCTTASAVAGLAALMDVVASSRLHLLILASLSRTPLVGIGRGSKVANFLESFDAAPVGEAETVDFERLDSEVRRYLNRAEAEAFRRTAATAQEEFASRLHLMEQELRRALA